MSLEVLLRLGFLTENTGFIGVLVIPGRGAYFELPGRLQKHGRLKPGRYFAPRKPGRLDDCSKI